MPRTFTHWRVTLNVCALRRSWACQGLSRRDPRLIALVLLVFVLLRAFRATRTALLVVVAWAIVVGPIDANVAAWVAMICFAIDVVVIIAAARRLICG